MCRLISAVCIISVLATLRPASGYKWVAQKTGDPIPENAIKLHEYSKSYVGRVNYYNIIVPATVTSQGAEARYLYNRIEKNEFEVLVATEDCKWEDNPKTMENVVRAGTAWDGEPIYVARRRNDIWFIVSIYLSSKKLDPNNGRSGNLICNVNNNWTDASSENIPRNAITNRDAAIARLLGPYSFVPGQVLQGANTATAVYEGLNLKSSSYQVLVGDSYEYSWKELNNGIPDYAVVAGESEKGELIYIIRSQGDVAYLVFSQLIDTNPRNQILVKNVK